MCAKAGGARSAPLTELHALHENSPEVHLVNLSSCHLPFLLRVCCCIYTRRISMQLLVCPLCPVDLEIPRDMSPAIPPPMMLLLLLPVALPLLQLLAICCQVHPWWSTLRLSGSECHAMLVTCCDWMPTTCCASCLCASLAAALSLVAMVLPTSPLASNFPKLSQHL